MPSLSRWAVFRRGCSRLLVSMSRSIRSKASRSQWTPQLGRVLHAVPSSMMADCSDEPKDVEPMARLIREGADVVAGSRYMRGGSQEGGPWLKRQLSWLAGMSLYYLAGLPVHDATNNFRAYSRRVIDTLPIEGQSSFALALELTLKAHWQGWRVVEVPTTWHDRTAGQSRFRLFAWLPHYLRWYLRALRRAWFGQRPSRSTPGGSTRAGPVG